MGTRRTMSMRVAAVLLAGGLLTLAGPGVASADSPWDGVKPTTTVSGPVPGGTATPDDSLWD